MMYHASNAPQFYLSPPSPCPYIDGRQERKIFTHLIGNHAHALNDVLTQGGFRRSQTIAYRPACENCQACISVRIVVDAFQPSKSFKRILRHNQDLDGTFSSAVPTVEQYNLFYRYLETRHTDGGMTEMNALDYAMMVEDSSVDTAIIEYRRRTPLFSLDETNLTYSYNGDGGQNHLYAVTLTDILSDGLSMVYSFFDPDQTQRSLGTFMILDHIRRARVLGLPYLYLGYWIENSKKMAYKARFYPQEQLGPHGWVRVG